MVIKIEELEYISFNLPIKSSTFSFSKLVSFDGCTSSISLIVWLELSDLKIYFYFNKSLIKAYHKPY